jgi:predicted subunit of tRNA(5-methylaminomethyl-2-thiouridylate) methyltransferase
MSSIFPGSDAVTVNIGKGIELTLNASSLPHVAVEHVVKIGLRNILMDAHASITEKEFPDEAARKAAAEAVALKKWNALVSGTVRVAGVRGPRGDSVATEMKRIARQRILGHAKSKGLGADTVKTNFNDWMATYVAKNEADLRAKAEANIAAMAELHIDLDDLMTE